MRLTALHYEILLAIGIEEMSITELTEKILRLREKHQGVSRSFWDEFLRSKVLIYCLELADHGYLSKRREPIVNLAGVEIPGMVLTYFRRTDKFLPPRKKRIEWLRKLIPLFGCLHSPQKSNGRMRV